MNKHSKYRALMDEIDDAEQQLADLKASLPKVRADAVREAVGHFETIIERNDISVFQLNHYADKLEAGNE